MEKLYVVYNMDYDCLGEFYLITEDKLEEFFEDYKNHLFEYERINLNDQKIAKDHIETIRQFHSITWKIEYLDEYAKSAYPHLSMEEIIKRDLNTATYGLDFFTTEVNQYFKK